MFWDNFERICHERDTNPTRVLKQLNLSPSKITLWKGGSLPKQEILKILAETLNCRVEDFFSDDESLREPVKPENEDEHEIIEFYRYLPREEKHKFMARMYAYRDEIEKRLKK